MKLQNIALALGLAVTGLIANITQASAITYQFNDVRFQDGGTLTGTFDYSPNITPPDFYSNINITTNGGDTSTFPPAEYLTEAYSQYGPSGSRTGFGAYGNPITSNTFSRALDLSFATPLTGNPGDQSIIANFSGEAVGFFDPPLNENERLTATRNIVAGSVSTVPEPTEQGLIVLGLPLFLGLEMKKRKALKNS